MQVLSIDVFFRKLTPAITSQNYKQVYLLPITKIITYVHDLRTFEHNTVPSQTFVLSNTVPIL